MIKYLFITLIMLIFNINVVNAQTITHVTLTCYQPVKKQCNNDPLTTADGSKINLKHLKDKKIKWCAISRDLLYLFPKNKPKRILIEGFGIYEVRDVMHKRHNHRVDILIYTTHKPIYRKKVKITILK